MRCFQFVTVDVFTARHSGGNPLAVFPAAEGLSDRASNCSPLNSIPKPQYRATTPEVGSAVVPVLETCNASR
jgi:hypothetical protein